jgi:hypothetical protein
MPASLAEAVLSLPGPTPLRRPSQTLNGHTDTALGNPPVRFAIAVKQRARYGLSPRRYALAKRLITRITRSETQPSQAMRGVDHRCVRHAIRSSTEVLFAQ